MSLQNYSIYPISESDREVAIWLIALISGELWEHWDLWEWAIQNATSAQCSPSSHYSHYSLKILGDFC